MIIVLLKRLLEMLALVAIQVLVCNHVHLMNYATPMLYVMFLAHLPLNANRIGNLLWGFSIGLLVDVFSNTPGVSSAAMTMTAMIQWPLLKVSAPKDCIEEMVPSYKTMGKWNHTRYIFLLALTHHLVYYALESFTFFHIQDTLIAFASSLALSLVILLTLETLRNGK